MTKKIKIVDNERTIEGEMKTALAKSFGSSAHIVKTAKQNFIMESFIMAKITISGDLKEEDILLIGKFFREFWKSREENIMLMVEEGTEHMSKEECAKFISRIFQEDDNYTEIPIKEAIASIEEKFKKKRIDDKSKEKPTK